MCWVHSKFAIKNHLWHLSINFKHLFVCGVEIAFAFFGKFAMGTDEIILQNTEWKKEIKCKKRHTVGKIV